MKLSILPWPVIKPVLEFWYKEEVARQTKKDAIRERGPRRCVILYPKIQFLGNAQSKLERIKTSKECDLISISEPEGVVLEMGAWLWMCTSYFKKYFQGSGRGPYFMLTEGKIGENTD